MRLSLLILKMSQFKFSLNMRRYLKLINYDSWPIKNTRENSLNSACARHFKHITSLVLAIFPRLFLSSCYFLAQPETNLLGLIIILPVTYLFFALQQIDLSMSLSSQIMTFSAPWTNCCWQRCVPVEPRFNEVPRDKGNSTYRKFGKTTKMLVTLRYS